MSCDPKIEITTHLIDSDTPRGADAERGAVIIFPGGGYTHYGAKECEPIWKEHTYNPVGQAAGLLLAGIFGRIDRTDEARAILTRIGKIGEGDNSTIARATLDGLDRLGERAPAIPDFAQWPR